MNNILNEIDLICEEVFNEIKQTVSDTNTSSDMAYRNGRLRSVGTIMDRIKKLRSSVTQNDDPIGEFKKHALIKLGESVTTNNLIDAKKWMDVLFKLEELPAPSSKKEVRVISTGNLVQFMDIELIKLERRGSSFIDGARYLYTEILNAFNRISFKVK